MYKNRNVHTAITCYVFRNILLTVYKHISEMLPKRENSNYRTLMIICHLWTTCFPLLFTIFIFCHHYYITIHFSSNRYPTYMHSTERSNINLRLWGYSNGNYDMNQGIYNNFFFQNLSFIFFPKVATHYWIIYILR